MAISTGAVAYVPWDTVDGCEILHHQTDGWNMLKPQKNNEMFTTYELVIRILLAHPQYLMVSSWEKHKFWDDMGMG